MWSEKLARWIGHHTNFRGSRRLVRAIHAPGNGSVSDSIVQVNGGQLFKLNTNSLLEWELYMFGGYETSLQKLMVQYLRPGDTAIDVGANIGIHALAFAAKVGHNGKVIAVEPLDSLANRLEDNIALNNVENIQIMRYALSSRVGEGIIYDTPNHLANRGMASLQWRAELDGIEKTVPITTLDAMYEALGLTSCSLIKVDVEGGEIDVLKGGRAFFLDLSPILVFEYVTEHTSGIELEDSEIMELLQNYQYRVVNRTGNMWIASKHEL